MASPGRDVHNADVDDVLSPRRQQEMAELLDVLRRFRPTKVAVETDFDSGTLAQRCQSYLAGEYTLSANEIDQIGIRLAGELGHETIYGVDADGEFPYYRVANYAKANGRGCNESPNTSATTRFSRRSSLRTQTRPWRSRLASTTRRISPSVSGGSTPAPTS
jgi:hypothetical protein